MYLLILHIHEKVKTFYLYEELFKSYTASLNGIYKKSFVRYAHLSPNLNI